MPMSVCWCVCDGNLEPIAACIQIPISKTSTLQTVEQQVENNITHTKPVSVQKCRSGSDRNLELTGLTVAQLVRQLSMNYKVGGSTSGAP